MDSENDYDVIAVNNFCSKSINTVIIPPPGSLNAINNVNAQHQANIQYDNINNLDVKAIHGGNKYRYFKIYDIYLNNINNLNNKVNITYKSQPITAAKKLILPYIKKINNKEIIFSIKEIKNKSKKKIYGPYIVKIN